MIDADMIKRFVVSVGGVPEKCNKTARRTSKLHEAKLMTVAQVEHCAIVTIYNAIARICLRLFCLPASEC